MGHPRDRTRIPSLTIPTLFFRRNKHTPTIPHRHQRRQLHGFHHRTLRPPRPHRSPHTPGSITQNTTTNLLVSDITTPRLPTSNLRKGNQHAPPPKPPRGQSRQLSRLTNKPRQFHRRTHIRLFRLGRRRRQHPHHGRGGTPTPLIRLCPRQNLLPQYDPPPPRLPHGRQNKRPYRKLELRRADKRLSAHTGISTACWRVERGGG